LYNIFCATVIRSLCLYALWDTKWGVLNHIPEINQDRCGKRRVKGGNKQTDVLMPWLLILERVKYWAAILLPLCLGQFTSFPCASVSLPRKIGWEIGNESSCHGKMNWHR
jgi:hypothetical protein